MSKWPVSEKVYQISHDPYDYEYQASKIWQGHPPEYKNLIPKIPTYINKANYWNEKDEEEYPPWTMTEHLPHSMIPSYGLNDEWALKI